MSAEDRAERRVADTDLRRYVGALFVHAGMADADATLLAETLVDADLSGVHSHGVLRVPEYLRKLGEGGVDPRGAPRVVGALGGCLVVDGGNAMGQVAAMYAMERAIERVGTQGIVAAAVRGSNHCGAVGFYARRAAARGTIGLATTNALPTMAPWGGAEPIVGINPLAIAIPAGRHPPLLFDGAFSGSAHGKIRVYAQRGEPIPEGWATDRDGRPTTDASAALEGLLLPIGGFKGIALAMMMGILSSLLSGAAYGTELGDMARGPRAGLDGHFLAAIDIAAFEDPVRFRARVDAIVDEVHNSRRASGVTRLYVPGEPEEEARARRGVEGIPLNAQTLADLTRVGQLRGIAPLAFL